MQHRILKLLTSVDTLKKESSVALYGSGKFGRQVLEWCKLERPDLKIMCFLDTDNAGEASGIPIIKASDYAKSGTPVDTILITSHFANEISQHLSDLNVTNFYVFDRSIMGLLYFTV